MATSASRTTSRSPSVRSPNAFLAGSASSPATIRLTESADPARAVLTATPAAFAALLATVKDG
ncbi:DUF397 domain-containing protein [Streptomyces sp. NPDC088766]|uniref:DUF397 domain-containing protein n=1 Tax=Streptomyces sp. NPDC088766 TaxID=3365893 RepID=UPI00381027DA